MGCGADPGDKGRDHRQGEEEEERDSRFQTFRDAGLFGLAFGAAFSGEARRRARRI